MICRCFLFLLQSLSLNKMKRIRKWTSSLSTKEKVFVACVFPFPGSSVIIVAYFVTRMVMRKFKVPRPQEYGMACD